MLIQVGIVCFSEGTLYRLDNATSQVFRYCSWHAAEYAIPKGIQLFWQAKVRIFTVVRVSSLNEIRCQILCITRKAITTATTNRDGANYTTEKNLKI